MKEVYTLADLQEWSAMPPAISPPIKLGVLGFPVAHSLSPRMQNAALKAAGLEMQYARFQISTEELEPALRLMCELGFVGVNLTVPHKVAASRFVDEIDPSAQKIGAINTILVAGGKLIGSNTDSRGFARAIREEFSVDLRDLRVLLLGVGGGAGRAIAMQCALAGCERLILVNRDFDKATSSVDELREYFEDAGVLGPVPRLRAVEWKEATLRFEIGNVDLVVNATPVGMKHSDPPLLEATWLAPHLMIYDTIYSSARTALLRAAAEAGARGANGLSMLLHQGALSFETWFDREAPLEEMRKALAL